MKGSLKGGGLHSLPRIGITSRGSLDTLQPYFCTPLDWSLLEVIATFWDPTLSCVTIRNVDLVPTLEEYDRFLSLSTSVDQVYQPPVWPHYRKWLAELIGMKTLVVDILT